MGKHGSREEEHGRNRAQQGGQGVAKLYALAALWLTISALSAGLLMSYFLPAGVRASALLRFSI
jgi:hypothetical protein